MNQMHLVSFLHYFLEHMIKHLVKKKGLEGVFILQS